MGKVAVPKTVQKPPSPRGDATEASVGRVTVPKTGQKSALQRDNLYPRAPSVHEAPGGHAIQTYPTATSECTPYPFDII